ncbi:GMC family oxidoreductase [Aestuariicella hydrocarbonica]|uniref:GMC family oxidoreductase n=1 Tax=Pseudomaricurvus hydrocarbonicus TaxID=1470433 RepID=A0A9E5MNC7_9GAMM|nr:GMC family oxidoreductase [Aestuariicella hydrocarbonica]NHO67388.1 GMC family oxidoreductase [Aestuariicella hydrocarbonica]
MNQTQNTDFDAIVVGSGITGGWAAKELTERGLKVLLLERGPMIEHGSGYKTEFKAPWELPYRGEGDQKQWKQDAFIQSKNFQLDEWNRHHFVNDKEHPYQTTADNGFKWLRSYQLGGRSLTWGRQCYRWGDGDFKANQQDGHGVDWPIRYKDVSPWYDRVESFIGVSGAAENLEQLPDGQFQKPMALFPPETALRQKLQTHYPERCLTIGRTANMTEAKSGRSPCQYRDICSRGCSFGAYFSTQSSTLPAAKATGNLTLMTDALVDKVRYDESAGRITGVDVINTSDRSRKHYTAKIVFLCAGSVNSVGLLLRSRSDAFPNGLANRNDVLGRYFMDHANSMGAVAVIPGFEKYYYEGNRPTGIVIPRFRNLSSASGDGTDFTRGYSYQGGAYRPTWTRGKRMAGLGQDFKNELRKPGTWMFALTVFAESLPRASNRITLSNKTDQYGVPQVNIDFSHGENEHAALRDAEKEARKMMDLLGGHVVMSSNQPGPGGMSIHEMGGARMGRDPRTSTLNGFNQVHDISNLFVTDGAAMASSACQNPSLTYMALTARAANYAADQLLNGSI